jgi:hypothetical protein
MGARGSQASRTMVRTEQAGQSSIRERSETTGISVRSGGHRAIRVRAADDDGGVAMRRKKGRHYVYAEPSAGVVHKKKKVQYRTYDEPSRAALVHKRRVGVAVEQRGFGRSDVRSRTSSRISAGTSITTHANVGRSASGQATTRPLTDGRASQSGSSKGSGATVRRSAPGGSGGESTGAPQ